MKRIKQLPENLINQIAAGEVIERPASAVKELVENSADAGAKRIEIEIADGGRDIRIADNGHGIHKDDATLAFSRHATSKIEKQKDLFAINTLGFRGEALASIISVAKVTCMTRTCNDETGIKIECRDSQIKISETGCAVGTVMEIKDLFYNIPARLKFLKTPQTELSHITETVQNIAVSHPEIAINLINGRSSVLKTTGSSDISTVISEIYSKDLIKELVEINYEDEKFDINLKGFISNPGYTRSNKKGIYVFINGRVVKCPIISKSLDIALKDMIPSGKYPFAVLNISMPPGELDVNVHPSKKEVKYAKPNLIFNFVHAGIKSSVEGNPNFKGLTLIQKEEPELFSDRVEPAERNINEPEMPLQSKIADFSKFADMREDEIIEVSIPAIKREREFIQSKTELREEYKEAEYSSNYKIIGQFDNTYILVETQEGLVIIDQHIADERYLYEKLKATKTFASQLLLTSETIEPDAERIEILRENAELFAKYGFEFEFVPLEPVSKILSNNAVALQAPVNTEPEIHSKLGVKLKKIPQILSGKNPEEIILKLTETICGNPEETENEILETMACKASVKAGEKLLPSQTEKLVQMWAKTKFNTTCPHGRKIAHVISKKETAKFFGR